LFASHVGIAAILLRNTMVVLRLQVCSSSHVTATTTCQYSAYTFYFFSMVIPALLGCMHFGCLPLHPVFNLPFIGRTVPADMIVGCAYSGLFHLFPMITSVLHRFCYHYLCNFSPLRLPGFGTFTLLSRFFLLSRNNEPLYCPALYDLWLRGG